MLPAQHRLRNARQFQSVLRGPGSRRAGSRLLVLNARVVPGGDGPGRLGLIVSKAVGNAVQRNRSKRVIRHIMASRLSAGTDIVIRVNPAAAGASTGEIAGEIDRLLARAVASDRSR